MVDACRCEPNDQNRIIVARIFFHLYVGRFRLNTRLRPTLVQELSKTDDNCRANSHAFGIGGDSFQYHEHQLGID